MARKRNQKLADWMAEHKITANELSALVNAAIAEFTGTYGTTSERGVFRWLAGEHMWPNCRQRVALERVTGRTSVQLGFRPRGSRAASPRSPEEDPVYRRAFLSATTTAGASLAAPAPGHRLGSDDVERMNAKLLSWTSTESRHGGTAELEGHAASLAGKVLELQQSHSASTRVRSEMYAVAAAFANSALWAAIDGQRPEAAQRHLDQTLALAGLAADPPSQFRVWGHAAMLFRQLGRPADALAAAQVSRASNLTRRDPFYASLALARLATYSARTGDARSALRELGLAQEALDRTDTRRRRPSWTGFYDQAELDHLGMLSHLHLGRWPDAERHAHRALARLRPGMERNRALLHAHLAVAQLGQREVEPAVAAAQAVPARMARHGRVQAVLDSFSTRLDALAPHSREARNWNDHYRRVTA